MASEEVPMIGQGGGAFRRACDKHFGRGVSDEEEEAFIIGYHAAIDQLRSDECYCEVAEAKQGHWEAIGCAADWLEPWLPGLGEGDS